MKLMEMVDFIEYLQNNEKIDILNSETMLIIVKYKDFLKTPITASQFVPVDDENNVLFDKEWKQFEGNISDLEIILKKFKEAQNRVFLKGFKAVEVKENEVTIQNTETGELSYIPLKPNTYQTIENPLLRHKYEMSDYAVNLIFGGCH